MIACEKAGRQARLIELDPRYCDVIVRRWQDYSVEAAVLQHDGRRFDEILASERRGDQPAAGDRVSAAGSLGSSR